MNLLIDGMIQIAKDQNMVHELNQRKGMGSWQHSDGWGLAYLQDDRWTVEKSTKPIYDDSKIDQFRNIKTSLAIIHARKKSKGDISLENTHPFKFKYGEKELVFCHNGHIRDEINVEGPFQPLGQTDSEALFCTILNQLSETDLIQAVKNSFKNFRNCKGTNFILSSKDKTYLGIRENVFPMYYNMKLAKTPSSLIICSEEIPALDLEWETLQPGIFQIENKTLNTSNF